MGVCSETKPTLLAGYIITIVAFVIHLIGFSTPYWNILTFPKFKMHFGLWKSCTIKTIRTISISTCGRYVVEVNANVSISKLANTTLF